MRIDKVKYTAQYDEFGNIKAQWIGMEAVIDDTESPERQLDKIKEMTDSWYKKNTTITPNGYPNLLNPEELPVINTAEERIGIEIENTTTKDELLKYKDSLSTPYLAGLYSTKLILLNNTVNK